MMMAVLDRIEWRRMYVGGCHVNYLLWQPDLVLEILCACFARIELI